MKGLGCIYTLGPCMHPHFLSFFFVLQRAALCKDPGFHFCSAEAYRNPLKIAELSPTHTDGCVGAGGGFDEVRLATVGGVFLPNHRPLPLASTKMLGKRSQIPHTLHQHASWWGFFLFFFLPDILHHGGVGWGSVFGLHLHSRQKQFPAH